MKDVLGNSLEVGDVVLFSTKFGQTAWLKVSIICKIKFDEEHRDWNSGYTASIMSADLYGKVLKGKEVSLWPGKKGYPQLGHGADPEKMFRLCHYNKVPKAYKKTFKPLIEAYGKYLDETR